MAGGLDEPLLWGPIATWPWGNVSAMAGRGLCGEPERFSGLLKGETGPSCRVRKAASALVAPFAHCEEFRPLICVEECERHQTQQNGSSACIILGPRD